MAEMISFDRPDGKQAPGWLDGPQAGPGIVLIQEWWGVNDQIKRVGARFADLGYHVLIPDLYRGKVTLESAEAGHLMQGLDFADAASQDVRGAVGFLKQSSQRVGVVGYCMGGAVAFLAAITVPELDAAVPFYGAPQGMVEQARGMKVPLLGHFARDDGYFGPAMVGEYESALKASGADATFHWYDAGHAFCNDEGAAYNPSASELAWGRTVDFLARRLK